MNPETINAIKDALAPAFTAIGQGGAYAWEIAVKGQYAEGIAMLVGAGLAFLGAAIALGVIAHVAKKTDGAVWMFAALLIIPLGAGSQLLYEGLFHVLAPEYKALEFFVQTVKS